MVGFEPSNHSVHTVRQCSSYGLGFVISKLSSIATTELIQTLPQCYAATTAARCFQDNWQLRDHGLRNQSRRLAATALDWARQPSACRRCWNWSICIYRYIYTATRSSWGWILPKWHKMTYGLQKNSLFQLKVNQFKFKKGVIWWSSTFLQRSGPSLTSIVIEFRMDNGAFWARIGSSGSQAQTPWVPRLKTAWKGVLGVVCCVICLLLSP